ncbi:hypothetical protein D9M73_123580 [compost metagenome]
MLRDIFRRLGAIGGCLGHRHIAEGAEGARHIAQFIRPGETGNVGRGVPRLKRPHARRQRVERPRDRAGEQPTQRRHRQNSEQRKANQQGGFAPDRRPGIGLVRAGADHPAPGRELLHEGDFGLRCVRARLGPAIGDEVPVRVALGRLDEFHKRKATIRISGLAQILALQLRLDRMHDHARQQIVDPEILFAVVAHLAERGERARLRLFAGEATVGLLRLILFHDAISGFQRGARLRGDIVQHDIAQAQQRDAKTKRHRAQRRQSKKIQSTADIQTHRIVLLALPSL